MLRLIVWLILIYLIAKILATVLPALRQFFQPRGGSEPRVEEKQTKRQFDNVQDADFEDITDKK